MLLVAVDICFVSLEGMPLSLEVELGYLAYGAVTLKGFFLPLCGCEYGCS